MKFIIWLENQEQEKLSIFVDLDETLVKTWYLENFRDFYIREKLSLGNYSGQERISLLNSPEYKQLSNSISDPKYFFKLLKDEGEVVVKGGNSSYISRPRPYAKEFMTEMKQFGKTYILTSGKKEFQEEVVAAHKLPHDGLYGRTNYYSVPKTKNFILIDDLGGYTSGVQSKMRALHGMTNLHDKELVSVERHIQVKPWFGEDTNDNDLLQVLSQVKELLKRGFPTTQS